MESKKRWLPVASLVVAGISSFLFFAVTVAPSKNMRALVFAVCVGSLIALVLGIAGITATRGEQRIPAAVGIVLGGIVFIWSALIFWLSTPF